MFICGITKRCSKPGESRIPLVIQTRDVTYIRNLKDGKIKVHQGIVVQADNKIDLTKEEIVAYGTEIVKEIGITEDGYKAYQKALDELTLEQEVISQ